MQNTLAGWLAMAPLGPGTGPPTPRVCDLWNIAILRTTLPLGAGSALNSAATWVPRAKVTSRKMPSARASQPWATQNFGTMGCPGLQLTCMNTWDSEISPCNELRSGCPFLILSSSAIIQGCKPSPRKHRTAWHRPGAQG